MTTEPQTANNKEQPVDANGYDVTADSFPSRIVVVGTTGSGKTTTARRIGEIIGAPHVELDALHWESNWTEADTETFRRRIVEATAGERWVVDGNYAKGRDLVWPRAELIVWLDYSIARIFRHLFFRTTRRIVTQEELWAGNRERFRTGFLSRESLFVWALQTHWKKRKTYPKEFASPELAHVRIVRLRSARATNAFLGAFPETVSTRDTKAHRRTIRG
jgi:adenylate kinase family enzyme